MIVDKKEDHDLVGQKSDKMLSDKMALYCSKCGISVSEKNSHKKGDKRYCLSCWQRLYVNHSDLDEFEVHFDNKESSVDSFGFMTTWGLQSDRNMIIESKCEIHINVQKLMLYSMWKQIDFDQRFAKTVIHEHIHWLLLKMFGIDVSCKFDNIANKEVCCFDIF